MAAPSQRYRVMHLINSQQRRGAEVFAAELASCMERKGSFTNQVCSLYDRGDDRLPVNGVPVHKLEGHEGIVNRIGLNPRLLSQFCSVLRDFKPHIVLAHGGDTLKYTACSSFFYRKATPVYRNIGTASSWAGFSVRNRLNRMFLGRIHSVISVSEYTKKDFLKVYHVPEQRVTVIPNGVDSAVFECSNQSSVKAEIRQELNLPQDEAVLIAVGNLSQEKGYADLLQTIGELHQSGNFNNHLLLVGDGPLRSQLELQTRDLGIADTVHFLGRRLDVARLMSASDLFVLSSKTEGMPAVLIEAGLAGLPSVAFDVGGVAEVVKHGKTGFVIPAGNFQELSTGLTALCRDQARRETMGALARKRCCSRFDIDKVTDDYQELFLRILETPSAERQ